MRKWLIRTTNNIILGPVSEDKLKMLVKRGSLEANDEICSEDGYWIALKERKLVDKYLFGGVSQGFNPIYHDNKEAQLDFHHDIETADLEIQSSSELLQEEEAHTIQLSVENENHQNRMTKELTKNRKEKTPLSGIILKILAIGLIILALILLYYRNLILERIFG